MIEMYTNEVGKSRPITTDAKEQSEKRKEWFANFEQRIKPRLPEKYQSVRFQIVGSVKKNLSSEEIDIVIRCGESDSSAIPIIRNERSW